MKLKKVQGVNKIFIRLTRSARITKELATLRRFTYYRKGELNKTEQNEQSKTKFALLFLNQGLTNTQLKELRSNLKPFNINFTQISTRFWSDSLSSTGQLRKTNFGNLLCLHQNSPSLEENKRKIPLLEEPLYLLHQFIQQSVSSHISNRTIGTINKNWTIIPNREIDFLASNTLTKDLNDVLSSTNLCLPWDSISFQSFKEKIPVQENSKVSLPDSNLLSSIFDMWFPETDLTLATKGKGSSREKIHWNLLLKHLKHFNLIYAGMVNLNPQDIHTNKNNEKTKENTDPLLSSYLSFDNFDLLNQSGKIYRADFIRDIDLNRNKTTWTYTFPCFEPFHFDPFNRKFLAYL
jgi:hypothetical protein